ncbi:MAG: HAMP domain-containing histidine kinase [Nonlabens sp.]|nr:HAMP domain-containing histidine kinase [Nonlabens sp.]
MNEKKYRLLLYLISIVILVTLSIQGYWHYKNYQESERQLHADLQGMLDQSVEDYFTIKAKKNTMSIVQEDPNWNLEQKFGDIIAQMEMGKRDVYGDLKYNQNMVIEGTKVTRGILLDTLSNFNIEDIGSIELKRPEMIREQKETRRLEISEDTVKSRFTIENVEFEDNGNTTSLKALTNRIMLSISSNKINLETLDSLLLLRLKDRSIKIDYALNFKNNDTSYVHRAVEVPTDSLYANAKLLSANSNLQLAFAGSGKTLLKRNLTSILLSLVLIATVIFCMFYLLDIIRKQKTLSEMKNDLISNITHEFKTPIATASAALEGLQHFTKQGDLEKTDRYLNMGRDQLVKLNGMVEKLLETATIDQGSLSLQYTEVDLNKLLQTVKSRFPDSNDKEIIVALPENSITIMADSFHLENALCNLVDNAIKYGGDRITLSLTNSQKTALIAVADSGTSLKGVQEKLVFDKFYRVPQGNTHNVKGHGIGLYYTRSIIEKHSGTIQLQTRPHTSFNITLPHA